MTASIRSPLRVWQRTWPMAALMLVGMAPQSALAQADDAQSWLPCSKMEEAQLRLACFDSWARRMLDAQKSGAAVQPGVNQVPRAQFGLEDRTQDRGPDFIESVISGEFEGWRPGDTVQLKNGQLWQITDGSNAVVYAQDPKVKIRRGALGAFYLEIEGTNHSPKVRRLR
jgi:hypothetical protein